MTSTFAKMIDPAHKRVARMLDCLTLDTADGRQGFAALACANLTERARVSLAWAALRGLTHDRAATVAQSVLRGAGAPIPALLGDTDEALFWADMATDDELRAYAWAAFSRLCPKDRADFLDLATGRAAALTLSLTSQNDIGNIRKALDLPADTSHWRRSRTLPCRLRFAGAIPRPFRRAHGSMGDT